MKRFSFVLLMQLICLVTLANPNSVDGSLKITGRVTDENGNALVGATVVIDNSLQGVSTNRDGEFTLTTLRAGSYSIAVSFIGYEKQVIDINLTANELVLVQLKPESIMGEAVVVSATRASSRMPIAQTTLNADEIKDRNSGFDVPYLLELIPSVVATSEGGTGVGNTAFRIRGSDMSRINVTVNGIPLNDAESQGVYWVNMPDFTSSVDNVQVQRGVGTSTNGAAAFGATVNFQTVTLKPEAFAGVEATAGSFGTFKTAAKIGTGLINDKFSFEARYSKVESDGYIDRGFSDHRSFFATGAWHTAKSILRFNLIHGEQHTGITWEGISPDSLASNRTYNPAGKYTDANGITRFYDNETDNYTQTHYHLTYSHQLLQELTLNTALHLTDGDGYYEQYKANKKFTDYGLQPVTIGGVTYARTDLIRQKQMDNLFYGTTLSLNYRKDAIDATIGGGWNRYDGDHFGNLLWTSVNAGVPKDYEWYRNTGVKDDFNVFAKAIVQLSNSLSLFADMQYRSISYDLSGVDDDLADLTQKHSWGFFNPKAGVSLQISPEQTAFASLGVAHREPTRADIKDAMKYGSTNTPSAEKLLDYELGYSFKSQIFALGLNLFYMDYRDQLVLTGKLSEVGYPLMENVDKSYRRGVELTTSLKPFSMLRWDASLSVSQNKIENFVEYIDLYDNSTDWNPIEVDGVQAQTSNKLGTTDISFSPNVVASSQIRVEPLKWLGVSLISKYVGDQYIDNTSSSDRMLDAYFVNNVKVDFRFKLKGTKSVVLEAYANNVFNSKYEANAWVYRAAFQADNSVSDDIGLYPQAGTNFMFKLGVEF